MTNIKKSANVLLLDVLYPQIIFVAADEERSRFEELVRKINKRHQSIATVEAASLSNTRGKSASISLDLNGPEPSRPRLSVYWSTEDWALALPRSVHHWKRRLGDTQSLFEPEAADHLIDATGVEQGIIPITYNRPRSLRIFRLCWQRKRLPVEEQLTRG